MTDAVIDLSAETGCFEVAVFCYLGSKSKQGQGPHWHDDCTYSVDIDRGHGRLTVYETTSEDKAVGVAEYIETCNRWGRRPDGEPFARDGEPFTSRVFHWDH